VPILRVEREHLDRRRESHRLQRETTLRLESPKELGFTAEVLGVGSNLQCCAGPQLHTPVCSERSMAARFVALSDWNVRSRGTPIQRNGVYCGVLRTGRGDD
ncbi:unnamed protein product, partial [Ixodes pacificus]